jgi:hypothetical protein
MPIPWVCQFSGIATTGGEGCPSHRGRFRSFGVLSHRADSAVTDRHSPTITNPSLQIYFYITQPPAELKSIACRNTSQVGRKMSTDPRRAAVPPTVRQFTGSHSLPGYQCARAGGTWEGGLRGRTGNETEWRRSGWEVIPTTSTLMASAEEDYRPGGTGMGYSVRLPIGSSRRVW